jgi:hypothetical protein
MTKVLIGAIVGGLLIFLWGYISHMALGVFPVKSLPNEAALELKKDLTDPGFYYFPGMDDMTGKSAAEQKAAEEDFTARHRAGPTGILIYQPTGADPMHPRQLAIELASNVLCALIASFLLSKAGPAFSKYGERVLFVTLLGLCAWLSISVSYWNWYRYPGDYIAGELIDQVIGFAIGGLAIAAIVKPARA